MSLNAALESLRRRKAAYLAQVSVGMSLNVTRETGAKRQVACRRDVAESAMFRTGKPGDKIGHGAGKPAPGVVTLTKYTTFTAGYPENATGQEFGKPTRVSLSLSPRLRNVSEVGKILGTMRYDSVKPTPSVTTPRNYFDYSSDEPRVPYNTKKLTPSTAT
jgi:hypothetical protein